MEKELAAKTKIINSALIKFLPKDNSIISKSMRYSILAGGKRLRPIFLISAAQIFNKNFKDVLPAACAVEYVHTYSLIHDDLPAMDNDDLRRGLPTNHKKFGEATAILCGDALLTESFNLITKTDALPENKICAVKILSDYAGFKGMIAGQAEDTLETGKWSKKNKNMLAKKLKFIQTKKTADLICASLKIGAVLANANNKSLKSLEVYGTNVGLAFQITDDILDAYADKEVLGKKGSDRDNDKLTALSLYGKQKAQELADIYIKKAKDALKAFGKKADILIALSDFITNRKY
ncbi:MAG: polyprenyl synthetase family protein [Elusimicrobiota bacterium]|jgi:geranylgeranyl diphosphate synthase type II|nr:polyprenyl synthetase family protein [Elusimicrobiota bacterium]